MRRRTLALLALAGTLALSACGSSSRAASPPTAAPRVVNVVASLNVWGDIARQVGGTHVIVRSIITDPNADPHLYESDARDAASIASASLVIENGLGYDDFVDQLLNADSNSNRKVVTVAKVLDVTASGANPHLWYDIPRVHLVARAIAAALSSIDPANKPAFDANAAAFEKSLAPLTAIIDKIRAKYADTPVAYTERVPEYLVNVSGLVNRTPSGFAQSVEDGNEPSPSDTQKMETMLSDRAVKALLYNVQTTSSVTQNTREVARAAGIPTVGVTETLPRSERNYQSWQLHQLQALLAALGG